MRTLCIAFAALSLTACSTFSFDKDRAAEQRKQELCQELETRDQPQCAGQHTPTP